MTNAGALTEQEITEARGDLAAGRPVTVWFTAAAVGVPVDGSAKVVAIGEPAVGEFVQVRPAGTRDELFCSPAELTRTRPSRRRTTPTPAVAAAPRRAAKAALDVPPPRAADPAPVDGSPVAASKAGGRARSGAVTPASTAAVAAQAPPTTAEKPQPARRRARQEIAPAEVSVLIQSEPGGDWVVSVTRGAKTVVRPTPVPPADVAQAAKALPPAVAEAVDAALSAARTRQQERVAALQAELEAARKALQDLGG